MPGPTQNYKLLATTFGAYRAGDVLPAYAFAAAGHDPAALAEAGLAVPTADPVTVEIKLPAAALPDVGPDVTADLHKTRGDLARAEAARDLAAGKAETLEREGKAHKEAVTLYVAECDRLKGLLAAAEADRDAARKDADAARAELADLKRAVADPAQKPRGK